jgi:ribulose-phosphate 3-epimerase
MVTVAPSILASDFARLAEECRRAEDAGADHLHCDVMDGHFVDNITIGPLVVEAVRRSTRLPLNVHLMIENPERYAAAFCDAGADYVLVHPECSGDPAAALAAVRDRGVKAGVALNPETPFSAARDLASEVDFVLVMSVHPGWGGQEFMREVLPKFGEARRACRREVELGVDGGINFETAREAVRAGSNYVIAGTFLFGSDDMAARIARLKRMDAE